MTDATSPPSGNIWNGSKPGAWGISVPGTPPSKRARPNTRLQTDRLHGSRWCLILLELGQGLLLLFAEGVEPKQDSRQRASLTFGNP